MRRLTITIDVAFGKDEPEQRDTDLGSIAERAGTNDPDERAELDQRRAIGFRHEATP